MAGEPLKDGVRSFLWDIKPYVPGKPIEEVERELGIKNVIKLASNENPLGPSPMALEALVAGSGQVSLYPDGYCYYLRRSLAEHLGVAESNLLIGNGSDEILKLVAETFISPGDEAIIAQPSFSEYEFVTRLMGGEPVYIPLLDFRHDLRTMSERIGKKTKVVFVCNPNNPTGTIVCREEVEEFLEKVPPTVLVVFDEAYYEYVDEPEYPQSLEYVRQGRSNVMVLRTFSKVYGLAGLRVGYGIASEELVSWIGRTREPFNVNSLAQLASRRALEDKAHLMRSREVNGKGKSFLYKVFDEMGLAYVPTQANFIFVRVGVDSREVFSRMIQRGVIIRTGDIFGLPEYVRITIGTEEQNARLASTLRAVLEDLG